VPGLNWNVPASTVCQFCQPPVLDAVTTGPGCWPGR
jgi:hypothetical protein